MILVMVEVFDNKILIKLKQYQSTKQLRIKSTCEKVIVLKFLSLYTRNSSIKVFRFQIHMFGFH
jgi:hypothetical protein